MSFFFTDDEIEKAVVYTSDPDCNKCGLLAKCNSPKMGVGGEGLRNAMAIGEAPGPTEDSMNDQFVGVTGASLHKTLWDQTNLDLHRDFWKLNALSCWPHNKLGGTITPTATQIKACRPHMLSKIDEYEPKHIVLVGGTAIKSFYGDRFSDLSISRWRGMCIPDRRGWVIPIYHPSYVARMSDENLTAVWNRDIKNIMYYMTKPAYKPLNEKITVIYQAQEVLDVLNRLMGQDIYFDYETTGLKPYRKGHKIVTIGVGNKNVAYSFPYKYRGHFSREETDAIGIAWKDLLLTTGKKGAHNAKFEDTWTREICGIQPANWDWCSMIAAHVLDNRRRTTGLKFQTYINFGVDPYDKDIKQYLRADKAGGNEFNNIEDAPLDKLLYYGGLDVFYGSNLMEKQKLKLAGRLGSANRFLFEGVMAMSDIQYNGICADEEYYAKKAVWLEKELFETNKNLMESEPAKRFKKATGKDINLRSNEDLKHLFYDIFKMKVPKETATGNPSVDKESLEILYEKIPKRYELFRKPFIKSLLSVKQTEKIANTYMSQFGREAYAGKIHPFYDLHIPISYRSSSSNPNFQNIPKRDEVAKKVCRSGIFPSPGNQLLEADYSGIEVAIAACYNLDPSMINYVKDKSTDMHRDAAMDIWKISEAQVSTMIRFYAKNCWVFPQFYGSWYQECSKNLIQNCMDLETTDNIKLSSIFKDQYQFLDHLQEVERVFWDERFYVYKQWKKDINKFYQDHGYIDTYLGFKYRGFMRKNDATNYPIQGTAFHCLLWSLVRINNLAKQEGWKTKIVGQIHDSIIFDLYPPEKDHVIKTLRRIGTQDIREAFDWIIVPLEIDIEVTPIDGSWYELEEY